MTISTIFCNFQYSILLPATMESGGAEIALTASAYVLGLLHVLYLPPSYSLCNSTISLLASKKPHSMSNELITSQHSLAQTSTAAPTKKDAPHFSRQLHNPPTIHKPAPTYSHVAIIPISNTARLITIAGQVGIDPQGNIAPTFAGQVSLALENLSECLASARCGKEDIVKVTLYIVAREPSNNNAYEHVRKSLYTRFWGEMQPPPNTVVYVAALALPELLFEVEAMAIGKI